MAFKQIQSLSCRPGRVAQSVGHLTRKSGVLGSIPGLVVSPSAFSRRAVVSYWRKYVHEVLVNRLGGLSLPRKSVVRLTDRPDMTLDVYRGRKTMQQQLSCKGYRWYIDSNCVIFAVYLRNIDQESEAMGCYRCVIDVFCHL